MYDVMCNMYVYIYIYIHTHTYIHRERYTPICTFIFSFALRRGQQRKPLAELLAHAFLAGSQRLTL